MRKLLVISLFYFSMSEVGAQSLMTVQEIYDYNIGDVFIRQIGGYAGPPTYVWDTITNKYYSASADTIFYTRNSFGYTPPACQTCTSSTSYATGNTFYYTGLSDTVGVGLGTKPTDWNCIDTAGYTGTWLDSVYYDPYFCNTLTIHIDSMGNGPLLTDSCYWYFEPYSGFDEYAKGLGHTQFYWNTCANGFPNCQIGYRLLYYKKGTVSCGTAPALPTGLGDVINENNFRIFPNPTSDELKIQSAGLKIEKVEMYNMVGEKILSRQPTTNSQKQITIDVSRFVPGIYSITVTDQTGNKVTRKIVKM